MHGRRFEAVAIEKYDEFAGVETSDCGLFVSIAHPMLAASPDGVVDNETLVEVKCPYTSRDRPITHVTVPYLKLMDGCLNLDTSHNYYYQIQGQLYCTGRTVCDLVVYTVSDMKVIRIARDDVFINAMVAKLLTFYTSFFRSAVLDSHLFHNYYSHKF